MGIGQATEFGEFLLREKIGAGGMAELYRAEIRGIGGFRRVVAIKRILPQLCDDEKFVTMLLDEARIAARLVHPNIVQVLNCGIIEGSYYITMEFVSGRPLNKLLSTLARGGRGTPRDLAVHIAVQLLRALDFAHKAVDDEGRHLGIIHRDVSPQNLMISFSGEVKLLDFGVATAVDKLSKTETGAVKGKLAYMAPEQLQGKPIDHRVDQYAAGIVLFEMLCGARAFKGTSDIDIMKAVLQSEIKDFEPRLRQAGADEALIALIQRGVAHDPGARFPDCAAFGDALLELIEAGERARMQQHLAALVEALLPRAATPSAGGADAGPRRDESTVKLQTGDKSVVVLVDETSSSPGRTDVVETTPTTALKPGAGASAGGRGRLIAAASLAAVLMVAVGTYWLVTNQDPRQDVATEALLKPTAPVVEPVPAPDPNAAIEHGSLVLTGAKPKMHVRINDAIKGYTDAAGRLRLELPAGEQLRVMVQRPRGSAYEELVELSPGQELELKVSAARRVGSAQPKPSPVKAPVQVTPDKPAAASGTLELACLPWCEVSIDGKPTGKTSPLRGYRLTEGQHMIEVFNPPSGKRQSRKVKISAGKATHVSFRLQ